MVETAIKLIAVSGGIVACVWFLCALCKPVKFVQLGRFAGNEAARESYIARRDALGPDAAPCRNLRDSEIDE